MTPGAIVEVVSGPWQGRVGVIDCLTVEGIAVRFRPVAGHARETAVVQVPDVRVVDLREARAA